MKLLITQIRIWCIIFHLLFLLKWPSSPMRTVLLISDISMFTVAVGRKLISSQCYFKSSHYYCAAFWVLYSFSERGHYLYCACLPQTWIHRAPRQGWKEGNEGERMKEAREKAVQVGGGGSWDHGCAYCHFYTHIYVYECVCIYIHIYTHTHTQTHTHTYFKYIYTVSNFGVVEWLEWGCYLCACSTFIIKHKSERARSTTGGAGWTENIVNIFSAEEMENIFSRIKSGSYAKPTCWTSCNRIWIMWLFYCL